MTRELLEAAEALVAELEGYHPRPRKLAALKAAIRPERQSLLDMARDHDIFRARNGRDPDFREALIMASNRTLRGAGASHVET